MYRSDPRNRRFAMKKIILAAALAFSLCHPLASRPAHATPVESDELDRVLELLAEGEYYLDGGGSYLWDAESAFFAGDYGGALFAVNAGISAYDSAIDSFTQAGALGAIGAQAARDGRADAIELRRDIRGW
jgi:hypothetical protein